jgi:hypothetical protein
MKRAYLALLLLACAAVLPVTGCGGGGSDGNRLSRADYTKRVQAIDDRAKRTWDAYDRAAKSARRARAAGVRDSARAVSASFAALKPPKKGEQANADLVSAYRQVAAEVAAALKGGAGSASVASGDMIRTLPAFKRVDDANGEALTIPG